MTWRWSGKPTIALPSPRAYDGRAQGADVLGEEFRAAIRERGGKKKAAACNKISTVTNHLAKLPRISLPLNPGYVA